MRLIDEIGGESEGPVVDITNIAEFFISNYDKRSTIAQVRKTIVPAPPPFRDCWVEYVVDHNESKGATIQVIPTEEAVALLRRDWKVSDEFMKEWIDKGMGSKWLRITTFFTYWRPTKGLVFIGTTMTWLDSEGRAIDVSCLVQKGNWLSSEIEREQTIETAQLIIDLAWAFSSCKNVTLVESSAPRWERRRRAQAGELPLVKYYVLKIDQMTKILRGKGDIASQGLGRALHICRGHFATYTKERPLFGTVTGRIWRPSHVRGSKEQGEILKDYRIIPPQKGIPKESEESK